MIKNTDLIFQILIDQLIDGDDYALISNSSTSIDEYVEAGDKNIGQYFAFVRGTFNNSILNHAVPSTITLNLRFDISDCEKDYYRISDFVSSLCGRVIQVDVITPTKKTKTVYKGYIGQTNNGINLRSGSQITLPIFLGVSTLGRLSSNGNWNDAIKKYDNPFTTDSGNFISKDLLLDELVNGTILEDNNFYEEDGRFKPIPNELFAYIVPSKTRLEVLQNILIAYNRIIMQQADGTLIIKALMIDDYVDEIFNVDLSYNDGTWIDIASNNNAINLPNRIDVLFGVPFPGDPQGLIDNINPNVFATCPIIKDDKILELSDSNGINYTSIYKSSTRLYNSGKWHMPDLRNVSLGANILQDTILANLLIYPYDRATTYYSPDPKFNGFAQYYAQLYMAEVNAVNYNATIIYDYLAVVEADDPIGEIITVLNCSDLDYPQNIVTTTSLSIDLGSGSTFSLTTAPLLSITASWTTV